MQKMNEVIVLISLWLRLVSYKMAAKAEKSSFLQVRFCYDVIFLFPWWKEHVTLDKKTKDQVFSLLGLMCVRSNVMLLNMYCERIT